MRWLIAAAAAVGLVACSPESEPQRADLLEVNTSTETAIDALPAKPAAEPPAPVKPPPAAAAEPPDLCWQDYCPCDPPQGGPDKGLCRQLRAGLPVDDEVMSIGAMARDARQQLDEFEAEYGKF